MTNFLKKKRHSFILNWSIGCQVLEIIYSIVDNFKLSDRKINLSKNFTYLDF